MCGNDPHPTCADSGLPRAHHPHLCQLCIPEIHVAEAGPASRLCSPGHSAWRACSPVPASLAAPSAYPRIPPQAALPFVSTGGPWGQRPVGPFRGRCQPGLFPLDPPTPGKLWGRLGRPQGGHTPNSKFPGFQSSLGGGGGTAGRAAQPHARVGGFVPEWAGPAGPA